MKKRIFLCAVIISALLMSSFTVSAGPKYPAVTTSSITNITTSTATGGGDVISKGKSKVIRRGVCWSTSQNPTIKDNHTSDGAGMGSYTSSITGLAPNTTYYVRAYAFNKAGTAYGSEVSFTTLASLPTVTTSGITSITSNTARGGGDVTYDGGATVSARGICWSTSQNPTINDSHTSNDNGTGNFTSSITGLAPNTTYYVRAYATNKAGTAYGSQESFTTSHDGQPCPGAATVKDYDNNSYNTVLIGSQCWMKENMRTTKNRYGKVELAGYGEYKWTRSTSIYRAYRYYPNDDSSKVSTYGYLYNWKAATNNSFPNNANPSGVQGICPEGWHVPSAAEWEQLIDYVNSQSQYLCDNSSELHGKAIASTTGWDSDTNTCAVGNNASANNATGFSALPAGFHGVNANYFGSYAMFWSVSDDGTSHHAYGYELNKFSRLGMVGIKEKDWGLSVRCLRD